MAIVTLELLCWFGHEVHATDRLIFRLSGMEMNGPHFSCSNRDGPDLRIDPGY
jgi:hypothetical protein